MFYLIIDLTTSGTVDVTMLTDQHWQYFSSIYVCSEDNINHQHAKYMHDKCFLAPISVINVTNMVPVALSAYAT